MINFHRIIIIMMMMMIMAVIIIIMTNWVDCKNNQVNTTLILNQIKSNDGFCTNATAAFKYAKTMSILLLKDDCII